MENRVYSTSFKYTTLTTIRKRSKCCWESWRNRLKCILNLSLHRNQRVKSPHPEFTPLVTFLGEAVKAQFLQGMILCTQAENYSSRLNTQGSTTHTTESRELLLLLQQDSALGGLTAVTRTSTMKFKSLLSQ